jgi:hypothetical protein
MMRRASNSSDKCQAEEKTLRISCNRPSERADLHCWHCTISIVNDLPNPMRVLSIKMKMESHEIRIGDSEELTIGHQNGEQLHQRIRTQISTPFDIENGKSIIGILVIPEPGSIDLTKPEKISLILETSAGQYKVPLLQQSTSAQKDIRL